MPSDRTTFELIGLAGYVLVASVNALPRDRKDFHLYDYIYDVTHLLLNSPMAARIEKRLNIETNTPQK